MTIKERPPSPGLTRIDTGYPHGVYPGWFITPTGMKDIRRRMKQVAPVDLDLDDLPPLPEATATCSECGEAFVPAMNRSDLCPRCRATRQHERRRSRERVNG